MSVFQDKLDIANKIVIVSPLNWGLGHASRLIPIIKHLLTRNNQIILFGENPSLLLLKNAFPSLESITVKPLQIAYSSGDKQGFRLFLQIPKFIKHLFYEHRKIKRIAKEKKIQVIISDNRYGLFTSFTKNYIITHQLSPIISKKITFVNRLANRITCWFINHFDKCLIPDLESSNSLTGELIHSFSKPDRYLFIGPVSQLTKQVHAQAISYKYMAILSGPEPQRSILENIILNEYKNIDGKCLLVRGIFENHSINAPENTDVYAHLGAKELSNKISQSNVIICRSGYSSIMDMYVLNKKCILVPTPGQNEQEYLGKHLNGMLKFTMQKQDSFHLK